MKNYVYIVSSLPCVDREYKFTAGSVESITGDIISLLDETDAAVVSFLMRGLKAETADADFYREALSHGNRFIREYFSFDLNLRNEKVKYLNAKLGRDAAKDVVILDPDADMPEFEETGEVAEILSVKDLLERERALDDFISGKIDSLTVFDYFDLDVILGFLVKIGIYSRWFLLDEEQGRLKFKELVGQLIEKAEF
ncbi:MAG: DUF2764 domain-containing protein [Bacteroidales bacterium]|nr:DUF2764 domain-containing protein [Bacteroidales bacterium]